MKKQTLTMSDAISTAKMLSEALPYLQRYSGAVVVVKFGGNAMGGQGKNVVFDHVEKSTGKFWCGQGGALRSLVQCDPSACRGAAEREMMLCLQLFGPLDASSPGEPSAWTKLGAFCSQRLGD